VKPILQVLSKGAASARMHHGGMPCKQVPFNAKVGISFDKSKFFDSFFAFFLTYLYLCRRINIKKRLRLNNEDLK
jgi:hypothetical protein